MRSTVIAMSAASATARIGVLAQRPERLLRAVGRRGQPVGAQSDPGQERHQREPVKEPPVVEVAGPAEQRRLAGSAPDSSRMARRE